MHVTSRSTLEQIDAELHRLWVIRLNGGASQRMIARRHIDRVLELRAAKMREAE
ncbi:MAG TPA: hypothetical protein VFS26_03845 [Solirubrobacterales bacterium]|nr:hypothetical protein [Solirubrobacterales bacterium]